MINSVEKPTPSKLITDTKRGSAGSSASEERNDGTDYLAAAHTSKKAEALDSFKASKPKMHGSALDFSKQNIKPLLKGTQWKNFESNHELPNYL